MRFDEELLTSEERRRRRTAEFFLPIAHQAKVGSLNTTVPLSACHTISVKLVCLSTTVYNTRKAVQKIPFSKLGLFVA